MVNLTVSKLAERVGVSPDTVRYYERAALLPPADRTPAGYRVYGEDAAERLSFIKGAQRLGLRLREVRELLDVLDRGLCPCGHTETLIRSRIAEIEAEATRLNGLKRELERLAERFPAASCDRADRWPCEDVFIETGKEGRR